MIINTEIVNAYLNGKDINRYASMFFYIQKDRSIFQEPKKDKTEVVSKIKDEILHHVKDFVPCNKKIWDTLFKNWQNDLDDIVLDLVVGCKEPNDAFVLKDLNERHHMIFDLLCWEKYVEKISLSKLSQNLLTHELFHVLIGKYYTNIEESEQFGNYYEKYACMCGMIYLAKEWQLGGYAKLKELFDQGYHGFAGKCI